MKKGRIIIGTSGWQYRHWRGTFYPEDLKAAEEFGFYCRHFQSVEINNSFYKLPTEKTFSAWRLKAPGNFVYAVKASRFITHMKKLTGGKQTFRKFFTRVIKLEEKLGPILFQLPPRWRLNLERLAGFMGLLPAGIRYSFEFRERSWYNEEVYTLLKKHNCAFCIYELDGHLSPLRVTADFVYIRLHGPGKKYQGSYSDAQLKSWANKALRWQKEGKDVYFYFDNDQEGYAAFNAIRLQELCKPKPARK